MDKCNDIFSLFHLVMKEKRKLVERELAQYGINHSEMKILMLLYEHKECLQESLTSQIEIDRSNVSRSLKNLEQMEFIDRKRIKSDKRNFLVTLTEHGMKICDELLLLRKKLNDLFISEISSEEIAVMRNVLRKIYSNCRRSAWLNALKGY